MPNGPSVVAPGPTAGGSFPPKILSSVREPNALPARLTLQTRTASGVSAMWKTLRNEAREVAWLVSVAGGLSALGVSLALVLAAVLHG